MNEARSFRVGKSDAVPCEGDPLDGRGILWVWEEPKSSAMYVVGCDPTVGITGWHRSLRTRDDAKVDNAAIEVFRVGDEEPDVQVAEFAAPVDAVELAPIVNLIGKMYGGASEDGEALCAIEVYPGPGWMTQRELINRFGYSNLPPWLVENNIAMRLTNRIGWFSSRSTRRDLWVRGINHLSRKQAVLRSPWLVEEMTDCTPDNFLAATARASYGRHDDRVVAMLIALWYCNEWSLNIEPTEKAPLESVNPINWQATDVSAAKMSEMWDERFSSLMGDN